MADLNKQQVDDLCNEVIMHTRSLRESNRNFLKIDYYELQALFEELRGDVEALAKYFAVDEEDESQEPTPPQERRERRPRRRVPASLGLRPHNDAVPVSVEAVAPGHTVTHMEDGSQTCECGLTIPKEG